jgi:hypothetical protein
VLAGASILGAGANIFGAQSAADAQKEAAARPTPPCWQQQQQGLEAQKGYFDTSTAPLSASRRRAAGLFQPGGDPGLTAPITMDQKTLEATPGYQFNSRRAFAALTCRPSRGACPARRPKAAATFATGLADSTYQNQFNNANTNKQNAFNFLLGPANLGTSAASTYAAAGTTAGNAALGNSASVGGTISGNTIGAGNAQAAADIATGKNVSNAITGSAGAYASAPGNALGDYGSNWGQANPGANGSSYFGPTAPKSMYG